MSVDALNTCNFGELQENPELWGMLLLRYMLRSFRCYIDGRKENRAQTDFHVHFPTPVPPPVIGTLAVRGLLILTTYPTVEAVSRLLSMAPVAELMLCLC